MISPNLMILYVENAPASGRFYETIFGTTPQVLSPGFVSFQFPNGLGLGLWSTSSPEFVSGGNVHLVEVALDVHDVAENEPRADETRADGVTIEQAPFTAVFGRTFVALDPDGHRIRVCPPDK